MKIVKCFSGEFSNTPSRLLSTIIFHTHSPSEFERAEEANKSEMNQ